MIVFDLACNCGYTFEGWFQDRKDFECQQTASFLVCPDCGSRDIRKILSPIRTQLTKEAYEPSRKKPNKSDTEASATALEALQEFIEKNFENVGAELATESLKMHYGVSEPRNIRGVTTELEEKKLKEEGITLLKIPMPDKCEDVN
jgi:hypothetical protein